MHAHSVACMHIGHGNMVEEYKMGDAVLGRTTQGKDLGVTFSADMTRKFQSNVGLLLQEVTKF